MDKVTDICPDCDGTGVVPGEGTEAQCCGFPNRSGECCGMPVPALVQVPEPCERCQATGIVSNEGKPPI